MNENFQILTKKIQALPGIYGVSCIDREDQKLILFRMREDDRRGLFFLTRICDHRYWEYGTEWNISLSVGDCYADASLPIYYLLQPTAIRKSFNLEVFSLLQNMHWHLTHNAFIEGFKLETFVQEACRSRIYDDFSSIVDQ